MAKKKAAAPAAPDQPYYLQKAHVKDYRSMRDAEVEFKPGLNIIIGPNGAGKTNFFNAIREGAGLLHENTASAGSTFQLGGAFPVIITYRTNPKKPQEFGSFIMISNYSPVLIQVKVADKEPIDVKYVGEAWNKVDDLRSGPFFLGYDLQLLAYGLPERNELAVIAYGPKLVFNDRRNPDGELPRHLFPMVWGIHTAFPMFQQKGADATQSLTKIVKQVSELYLSYLTEYLLRYTTVQNTKLSEQFSIVFNEVNDEFVIRSLFFEYESNGNWLRFDELSDGTQRLVYIISQLIAPAFYQAKSRDTFEIIERHKIILLEEPELGIHPHQLHLLLNLIREVSEKHQIILTTHSPQVLDMLRANELDRITICELLDPKKGTQFRKLTEEQQEHARRYMKEVGFLSDYWRLEDLDGVIANSTR